MTGEHVLTPALTKSDTGWCWCAKVRPGLVDGVVKTQTEAVAAAAAHEMRWAVAGGGRTVL